MAQTSFLQTGTTFVNGNTYQASDLNNAINNAQLTYPFISQWPSKTSLASSDEFILLDSGNNFHNTTAASLSAYVQSQSVLYAGVDSGTVGGKYVLSPSPALSAYSTGQIIVFKITNTNVASSPSSGTATLNVNGLGAVAIQIYGNALAGGELRAGATVGVLYDGFNFQIVDPPLFQPRFNCRLNYTSSTAITLIPFGGNQLCIQNGNYTIPSAGVVMSNSGLSSGTLYYIYAYLSSGTMTMEGSATAWALDSTGSYRIKSGDSTRTFVGWVSMGTGSPGVFESSAIARHV